MVEGSAPIIKRAARTYGKPRKISFDDTSFDDANTSLDTHDDAETSQTFSTGDELPPNSDAFDAPNTSFSPGHALDDDDDGLAVYEYDWQKKLREMRQQDDDEEDNNDSAPTATKVATTQGDVPEAQPTRPASPADSHRDMSSRFGGSLSSLTNSSQPSATHLDRDPFRIDSSPPPEDQSDHDRHRPSTPQTSPRHPFGTPLLGSSSTPPTSIEMPPVKAKGKARATELLQLNGDDELVGSSKPSKRPGAGGRGKKKDTGRVKAPTKKERIETQKATARILADQPTSIARVQAKALTLTALLERYRSVSVPVPPRAKTPQIPTSDPIQSSSPAVEPLAPIPEAAESSKKASKAVTFVGNGLLGTAESESDDEDLPDALMLVKRANEAEQASKVQKQLLEIKQRALARQQQSRAAPDGDDSDLEIVDNPESVLRDEGQARRVMQARGARPSKGRANQLAFVSPNARRKSAVHIPTDESQARHLLQVNAASAFDPVPAKEAKEAKLTHKELNLLMLQQAAKQAQQLDREKQEDWKRRGGRLKTQPEMTATAKRPAEIFQEILQKRRAASEVAGGEDEDESDEEWRPEDNANEAEGSGQGDGQGSDKEGRQQSTAPMDVDDQADDEGEDDNPFLVPRFRRPGGRARTLVATQSDDEDDAENRPPLPSALGRVLVRDSSVPLEVGTLTPTEIESEIPTLAHRNSVSSIGDNTDGSRTEDGTDKENDVQLSFDRGEDKENTKVHSPIAAMSMRLGRSFSTLFADDLQSSPSGPSSRIGPDGVRSPLKELPKDDDDDPFAFTPGPPLRLGGMGGMSSLEASPMDFGGGGNLQPAFSLKGKERARDASPLGEPLNLDGGLGGGGFSQFVTQAGGARGFEQLKRMDDDIDLTPEPGLQAVVDVSNTFRKKADEIFEKEQAALAEQGLAAANKEASPEMFVDANGFLTQTRPTVDDSPLRLTTQFTPRLRFSTASSPGSVLMSSGLRQPLAPLLTQDPDESDLPTRRRLRKRDNSVSPERILAAAPKRNVYDVLGKRSSPKGKGKGKIPVRSEFIEGEAEESDDERTFGFGGTVKKPDDEEEDDGEDQDQPLPDLVDDKEMDRDTLAEDAVREKDRELREIDDKNLEKLHMDAATGKLRVKRRDRGIGFEDSDSEEEGERRPRPKKARKDNDNIAALAKRPETQAFANEYRANMYDDENEFEHLNKDAMELDLEQPQQVEEEPEIVDAAQVREQLRKVARERQIEDARVFDPEDTSWIETAVGSDDEMEEEPRVREVSNEAVPARRPNAEEPMQSMSFGIDEANRARMAKWAKSETSSRTAAVVGRNTGGSAAVTGHGKSKMGAGSFKAPRAAASSSVTVKSSKISRGPSVLSAVSRRDKFAS
ncbi:hypothetical protein BD310DRAFT_849988 [Dichomitus squalens]|uniref:DNA replication checkpoint mediator MRC1 domain-containing protein n=1 Tax=Dichomitus squalens TaxID=114155 RepID=A0A4Q9PXX1_9APHY|nr:hypothetical protein BD310DRAFT_849988 [Dichomitus squalens]